jgi:glycolate dehydrogenase FAD-binding subunit
MVQTLGAEVGDARSRWGPDASRPAGASDGIDGHVPGIVLQPPDVATLSDMLRWAALDGRSIAVRGGGTKLRWGRVAGRVDALLSMLRIDGPIDHCAGDLTVTTAAGARLGRVNATLAGQRQWLPLDPIALEDATIGGVVATNDSGPRRHLHGTPRDLIIGVEMALAGGRTAKAGGRVVKNVAGYDLPRLLCGSFGSLAVITSATFKLAPLPPASRTLVADAEGTRTICELATAISRRGLTPSAIEIESPPPRLLIRFETTGAAAEQQAAAAKAIAAEHGVSATIVETTAAPGIWRDHGDVVRPDRGTVLKLAVLPTQVPETVDRVGQAAQALNLDWRVAGRVALGVLYIVFHELSQEGSEVSADVGSTAHATAIEALRKDVRTRGGSAVIVAASPRVRQLVDPWGDVGDGLRLMRAVKAQFDPRALLNPGRGPGGL